MDIKETWRIVDKLFWSDLEVDQEGLVTVNEVGRCLRQQGINVSNFVLLRLVSEDSVPSHEMGHEQFVVLKKKLKEELRLKAGDSSDPQEDLKKRKAYYLYQWKEYSGSRNADGEIPLSELENVIFCECNPTGELLNAIKAIKNDGSESLNFEEFCEILENLPKSGIIDEDVLMTAFRTEDVDGSGFISRAQLYDLLIDNGSEPLNKDEVDEMMDDCGVGDKFKYSDWIQRVITIKSLTEK